MTEGIEYIGKREFKCTCCGTYKMNGATFRWKSTITKACLGIICKKCAGREAFGSNYRRNKIYKEKWSKV